MEYEKFIKNLENKSLPSEIINVLQNGKFLINDEHDEYDDFLVGYRQTRYGPQDLVVYLTPTLKCNASCEYCFQRDIRADLPREEGPARDKTILFIANNIRDATGLKITWFGGEPLLNPTYIEHMSKNLIYLAKSAKKPYYASMVTNGMLLNQKSVDMLLRSQITHLQISLDGTEEIHNSIGRKDGTRGYRTIIDNILKLPEEIKVALRINVSRKNIDSIPKLIEDLATDGLNRSNVIIHFPLVYDFSINNPKPNFENDPDYIIPNKIFGEIQLCLEAYAQKLGFQVDMDDVLIPGSPLCHAIKSKGFSIWPNGSITRCIHEVDTPENLNISDQNNDVKDTPSLQKWTTAEVFSSEPCRSCYFLPICGGSCVHERFEGIEPPLSCPPSKWTIGKRMQWYEAASSGDPIPVDIDKNTIAAYILKLKALPEKQTLLMPKTLSHKTNSASKH